MSEPFVGEIRLFAGDFAPRGWAFCNGQVMPISQNPALFSVIGKTYGGDGKTTFALPDLQGRAPLQQGAGTGLTAYPLGDKGGMTTVALQPSQMPAHTHQARANSGPGRSNNPGAQVWAATYSGRSQPYASYAAAADTQMSPQALAGAGNSASHNNRQPYLGLSFIIALDGIYPVRP